MKVGVLALQGAFAAHGALLDRLGVSPVQVRTPQQLADVDRLVLPGGESTTMSMMLERSGLTEPLEGFIAAGRPVLGTCAGAILLSSEIVGGREDQVCLSALPVRAERNAFGRQLESFEADIDVLGMEGGAFHGVFIRAPRLEAIDNGAIVDAPAPLEVLAEIDGSPALVRSGSVMACTFHPELSGDTRLHDMFCEI